MKLTTFASALLLGIGAAISPNLMAADAPALPPSLFLPELILPTDDIPASSEPEKLRKKYFAFSDSDFTYEYEGQQKTIDQFIDEANVRSFLILKDGKIVYERNVFPYSRWSKHQSWSVNKQILSALVGIAIEEGAISSVEDPMDQYDPRLAVNGFAGITFRQALQMSSGISYNEQEDRYNLFFDVINDYYSFGRSGATLVDKTTAPELTQAYEPDSKWQYASINSQAIAMGLTAAINKPLQEYLYEKLFDPMGIADESKILVDGDDTEFTFCCLYATSRTYAAIGLLYSNYGFYNGKQIIPADWVRLSTSFDDPTSWTGAEGVSPEGNTSDLFGFAYHWWPLKGEREDFTALGVYGQSIHILPKQNTVIVRLSGDYDTPDAHRIEAVVLGRAIADYLD
ncbi:serine hydrolase domain-containing protein [Thalassolituus oleivorans]|uniref:serine hydrolase domain-containing protein n=1 Tax=Thalassolituus oleivorans TaxID=187493 RepID=UPI0023F33F70|nr:serine hydrolase [Thalassolituus oleivorans]